MKKKGAAKAKEPVQLDRDWIKGVPVRGDLRSPVVLAQRLLGKWTHKEAVTAWGNLEKVFGLWTKGRGLGESDIPVWKYALRPVDDPIDLVHLMKSEGFPPYISLLNKWGDQAGMEYALICLKFASIEGVGLSLAEPYYKNIDSVFALKAGYWLALDLMIQEMKEVGDRVRLVGRELIQEFIKHAGPSLSAKNKQISALPKARINSAKSRSSDSAEWKAIARSMALENWPKNPSFRKDEMGELIFKNWPREKIKLRRKPSTISTEISGLKNSALYQS